MNYEEIDRELRTFTELETALRKQYFIQRENLHGGSASSSNYLTEQDRENTIFPFKSNHNYLSEKRFIPQAMTIAVHCHPRYMSTDLHRHEFLELVYVYDGQCMQTFGNSQVAMHKGNICILAPNVEHAVSADGDDSLIINILVRRSTFDTAFSNLLSGQNILADFFARILYGDKSKQYILFHTLEDEKLRKIVLDMMQEFNSNGKYTDLMLKSYLMLFLGQLLRDHEQDALIINNTNNQQNSILALLQYIQERYQTVTLSQVADWFGFSYIQTSRLIKEYTGRTFSELRREMRVHKARELLLNPSISMEEIAEAAGYHDISHFYRDFKQFYEMTPMVYRAKQYKD